MINPGDYRHKITIQEQSADGDDHGQDDYGQPEDVWTEVATPWASIDSLSGKELFAAKSANSEVTHKVKMRYRSGITPDMRILFKGRVFEIKYPLNPEERNEELILMCKELI